MTVGRSRLVLVSHCDRIIARPSTDRLEARTADGELIVSATRTDGVWHTGTAVHNTLQDAVTALCHHPHGDTDGWSTHVPDNIWQEK